MNAGQLLAVALLIVGGLGALYTLLEIALSRDSFPSDPFDPNAF